MNPGSAVLLSWRLLWHNPARLATSLGALAFAVFLMLIQMGFRNSLLDSVTALLESLDADILVMHKEKDNSIQRETIPLLRVQQTLSVEGVAAAYPLWFRFLYWKNLENGAFRPIRVLGFRPDDPMFLPPDIRAGAKLLGQPGTALLDSRSRSYLGRIGVGPAQVQKEGLSVVGTFAMATDLEVDGNLLVSDETFARITHQSMNGIELIAVKLKPGAEPQRVIEGLRAGLPGDAAVRTKDEVRAMDFEHWDTGTPVSLIVFIGMAMGFVVGVVICYQILYTEVADHLAEFATLRAIGFGKAYIIGVVLVEAVLLSVVGLIPSLAAGWVLYRVLEASTGLLLNLTLPRMALVAGLTVSMCVFAGILALRKVLQADPAELF
ncbi:MAG: FtsX-like permease family protein [Vicinamibacteria bacterium]|nr:FtsX-like permease family protein [Vicinamibacteria bacterium]